MLQASSATIFLREARHFFRNATGRGCPKNNLIYAGMAEKADALDSGSSRGSSVQVQLLLPAPRKKSLLSTDKGDFFQ